MKIISVPRSVTKVTRRNGVTVEFTDNVDRVQYTLQELSRAALRDTGKYIRAEQLKEAKKMPGMKKNRRAGGAFQYWVRKQETDLITGSKHGTWYGEQQELGDKNQPKRGIISSSVKDNIPTIRNIQGQYLSYIEDENKALSVINEEEYTAEDD